MLTDGETSSLVSTYEKIASFLNFEAHGIEIDSVFITSRNKEGIVHQINVTFESDCCGCGCKRKIFDFRPVAIVKINVSKDITVEELTKLGRKFTEQTEMSDGVPMHSMRVESGLSHVKGEGTIPKYYPNIHPWTGVYV